jgi:quinol monooxygenase YgiN
MIVVVGRVQTSPEHREALVRLGQMVASTSRAEAGCLGYRFYEDTERENHFLFVEEWESDAALQQHFATAHIAEFMGAVPATLVAPPDVQFHTIAASRGLEDVGGA